MLIALPYIAMFFRLSLIRAVYSRLTIDDYCEDFKTAPKISEKVLRVQVIMRFFGNYPLRKRIETSNNQVILSQIK